MAAPGCDSLLDVVWHGLRRTGHGGGDKHESAQDRQQTLPGSPRVRMAIKLEAVSTLGEWLWSLTPSSAQGQNSVCGEGAGHEARAKDRHQMVS